MEVFNYLLTLTVIKSIHFWVGGANFKYQISGKCFLPIDSIVMSEALQALTSRMTLIRRSEQSLNMT